MAANLIYRVEELQRDILLVSLHPELNDAPWTDIEEIGTEIVERIRSRNRPRAIVDLSPLDHMGSAMVALVVRIWKAVSEGDGRMVVVNNSELVGEVLEISGLAAKWTIVPTREMALEELGGNGSNGNHREHNSRKALPWLILALAALVLGILGAADAIAGGFVAQAIGRIPLLGIAGGLGALALLGAALAARQARDAIQLVAVVVATLSGVLVIAAILLIINRNVWAAQDLPPENPPIDAAEV